MTFGPKPGEIAAVEREGVDAWFERQLHPEQISDEALNQRLSRFPAMQLPQQELLERYPTPGMLRRYSRGEGTPPRDNIERAIYDEGAFRFEQKAENKLAKAQSSAGAPAGGAQQDNSENVTRSGQYTQPQSSANPTLGEVKASPDQPSGNEVERYRDALLIASPSARLQQLAAMPPVVLTAVDKSLRGRDKEHLLAGMSPEQAEQIEALRSPERLIQNEVLSTRILRDVYSQRELQAVMTDFWLNHFSVYLHKNQNEPYLLPSYEREAILPHALGRFEDLLVASAESPAMLLYLDNSESVGPNSVAAGRARENQLPRPGQPAKKRDKGINENYARELMELHTLGVQGGYTQQDVIEVAKCFSGWTIDRPTEGGAFEFNPKRHEPGQKMVLGHVIEEGGMEEGLAVLHLLATSPHTAHFVSEKLAQRFVSDTPPVALVNRMAASFLKTNGDIKALLTTMFQSPEFWSAAAYRAKVKTPLEFAVSAVRATGADVSDPLPLALSLERLGMPIYGMQTPNGYSWEAASWVSSNALLTRMNFALMLSANRLQGTRLDLPALLPKPESAGSAVDELTESKLETALLGQPAAPQTRMAVLQEASTPGLQTQAEQNFRQIPASTSAQTDDAPRQVILPATSIISNADGQLGSLAGLLLGSPDFQRR